MFYDWYVLGSLTKWVLFFMLPFSWACMEIEVEGRYGWAEKLPTWYRTEGGRVIGLLKILSGGRPINGYWLFAMVFWFLFPHLPFISGLTAWTFSAELAVLQFYVAFVAIEDFLWFVLNPHYKFSGYTPENVWWHLRRGMKGIIMRDYLYAVAGILLLAIVRAWWSSEFKLFVESLLFLTVMGILILATVVYSPYYHQWYVGMRQKDDRDKAGIFPSGRVF